ncbi:general secretion pathway protein GspB [Hydrogenophaga sp. BPS33]|uniref:general secretion pathway protein GspB n=1 Tax=Hydrogenophaga sp. BPS33 TaxID=2651974 RepID=UPI00131F8297|nr:general secretion pathway protein GspB [Hydrogenophaga sp. BPS33]QHE85860.1 hypothetical protein F9K07_13570 [Hydrogenophaga sp. BPS33]
MSYILDALQRADAERERGAVPGLHSQVVPPVQRKTTRAARHRPTLLALAILGLLMVAVALWWWNRTHDAPVAPPAPVAAPSPPPSPEPVLAEATPTPAPAPAPPSAAAAAPVRPILNPPRPEPPKARAPRAAATSPSVTAAAPKTAPAAPAVAPTPAPPAASAASAASAATVRSFAELTPEARAQLPQVNVSGSTYSKNPALRMLIVNGKVMQEGQDISPGFKLESIGQRSAVLNHQGLRYSIGY